MTALRNVLLTIVLLGCFLRVQDAAGAEPRTALVVGNAAYSFSPLANPVNDARDVADALRGAGFEVMLEVDADQRRISAAVRAFADALKAKGGVGLFYFAGHGVQANGENYLIPIGDGVTGERDLTERAINAGQVVEAMAATRNSLNIVILDACRDNPITSGGTRGLSRIDASSSLFVSFSTSPGAVALDGTGRNSPYTKHLTRSIATSNLNLEETFKRTLKGVYQETTGKQTPWLSSSFFGEFVFRPEASPGPGAALAAPVPPRTALVVPTPGQLGAAAPPTLGGVYRADGTNADGSRYRGMVSILPDGKQLHFTWWIGQDVFRGVGHFAGRMLVVDWGQKHPVLYTLAGGDRLDGEWADGTATETLDLYGKAAGQAVSPPQGRYRASGSGADGSRYSGTVTIARRAGRFHLTWQIGATTYQGSGTLNGNILTVDWGSSTPVVYALGADGVLKGLWDAGKGEEILIPAQ